MDRTEMLRRIDLFADLPEEEVQRLAGLLRERQFPRRRVIFTPEDAAAHAYFLQQGHVRLYRLGEDGREATIALLWPGGVFGISALLGSPRYDVYAQALDNVAACRIAAADLVAVLRQHPEVMLRLVVQLARQIVGLQKTVEDMAIHRARERLVETLLLLSTPVRGHNGFGAARLEPGLTHEDLAKLIGTSRETVSRLLGELEAEGWVHREGRALLVRVPGPAAAAHREAAGVGPRA